MGIKIYLILLILCTILYQGSGTLSDQIIKRSWDLHVRKKRVVNKAAHQSSVVRINEFPYIVSIEEHEQNMCVGSILSPYVIITAAHCVESNFVNTIRSGSSFADRGIQHNITRKVIFPYYRPFSKSCDLALVQIFPSIDLVRSQNKHIALYSGHIPENTFATVAGWGSCDTTRQGLVYPKKLRAINVVIISNSVCERLYENYTEIWSGQLCTHDESGTRYCGFGDSGAPLVIQGQVVGVYAWSRGFGGRNNPDVFTNLSHPYFYGWVMEKLALIHSEIQSEIQHTE